MPKGFSERLNETKKNQLDFWLKQLERTKINLDGKLCVVYSHLRYPSRDATWARIDKTGIQEVSLALFSIFN